jgi:glucose-1-phosphate thymidylyltransferase
MTGYPADDGQLPEPPVVGLIPAGGKGTRLKLLPCSKELLPVGFARSREPDGQRLKAVSEYLLEQMLRAGCQRIFFILRDGKWDIPAYFGSGAGFGANIGYLLVREPYGPPFTIESAAAFVQDSIVVTGFPDMLLYPEDLLAQTVGKLRSTTADVVLATLPGDVRGGADLVRLGSADRVDSLTTKEENPSWRANDSTWAAAAWRSTFTSFLVAQVARLRSIAENDSAREWPLGAVIAAAIEAGLDVRAQQFEHGACLDIGEPARLATASDFPGVWNGR